VEVFKNEWLPPDSLPDKETKIKCVDNFHDLKSKAI